MHERRVREHRDADNSEPDHGRTGQDADAAPGRRPPDQHSDYTAHEENFGEEHEGRPEVIVMVKRWARVDARVRDSGGAECAERQEIPVHGKCGGHQEPDRQKSSHHVEATSEENELQRGSTRARCEARVDHVG